nr:pentapeptide repeat-containing protein [Pseudanabaena sp. FACHB-2040]
MPVAKTREFKEELLQANSQKEFDGLRRIADVFPDISFSPLIVLVDQFEEIYTLCTDAAERDAFVENLLCAASNRSQRVSIILTLRSDFLGATQQHPRLNKLFSSQGFLVPIMQPEELAIAITEPAKRAGHALDKATVQWLIRETEGQEAALPLLQFALTQIWEGLRNGVEPADTLKHIGGVGGALASEAKRLYESLTPDQQRVARCTFLALVQINEDNKNTRRRAAISELITGDSSEALVREVIDCFARPGVWILVTSCNEQQVEMLEVAHEALIRNWKELQDWLKEHWETLRQKRRIEQVAIEWSDRQRAKDCLLQGRSLRDARSFLQTNKNNSETALSSLAEQFIRASRIKQRQSLLKVSSVFAIFPFAGTLAILHFALLGFIEGIIDRKDDDCQQNRGIPILVRYMIFVGQKDNLEEANFCNDVLNGMDLSGATLWRANFRAAHLAETNLSSADFRGADFSKANLKSADFSEALLEDAKFEESFAYKTNFETAKGLQQSQLEQSILCQANLPEKFSLDPNRDCRELGL